MKEHESEALQFDRFLDHVKSTNDKRLNKARLHKNFWDNQCQEMKQVRKSQKGENGIHKWNESQLNTNMILY